MNHTLSLFETYWSDALIAVNLLVFANLVGALLLGLLVGYERSYHGRAAGMRTYGIVCMASAALTVFAGYPGFWWGGMEGMAHVPVDPTRVVQGIVTGVGMVSPWSLKVRLCPPTETFPLSKIWLWMTWGAPTPLSTVPAAMVSNPVPRGPPAIAPAATPEDAPRPMLPPSSVVPPE